MVQVAVAEARVVFGSGSRGSDRIADHARCHETTSTTNSGFEPRLRSPRCQSRNTVGGPSCLQVDCCEQTERPHPCRTHTLFHPDLEKCRPPFQHDITVLQYI